MHLSVLLRDVLNVNQATLAQIAVNVTPAITELQTELVNVRSKSYAYVYICHLCIMLEHMHVTFFAAICVENALECTTDGCTQCKPGYTGPDCCDCDSNYYRAPDGTCKREHKSFSNSAVTISID